MDRNSVIGLVLIAVILVVFSIFNMPTEEERLAEAKIAHKEDSIRNAQNNKSITKPNKVESNLISEKEKLFSDTTLVKNPDSLTKQDSLKIDSLVAKKKEENLINRYGIFYNCSRGKDSLIVIQNEKLRLTISKKGGNMVSAELLEFKSYYDYSNGNKKPLMLFDRDKSNIGVSFTVADDQDFLETKDLYFEPKLIKVKKGTELKMRASSSDDKKYIEFCYFIPDDSYTFDYKINIIGLDEKDLTENDEGESKIELKWNSQLLSTEKLLQTERMVSSVFYKYKDETRDYLSETSDDSEELSAKTEWIAFKQSYFSVVLMDPKGIDPEGSEISISNVTSDKYIKDYNATINLSYGFSDKIKKQYRFYIGPNDYNELVLFDNGMEKIVNIGWGIFGWVNMYLVIPIFNFLDGMNISYWLIILLLTIIVKILIMPLTYKNYKSSAKMRVLKPEIEEITKNFKDGDPMKKQQATMALYRSSGVNPMAGCIPMLIQMPVLIAVFRFFPSAIELRQQTFMWADDLSAYDSIANIGYAIPFYGDHVSLFTLLMAASTILITRMNSGQMDSGMPGMKFMMYFFPVMMIFFFNNMAAGLSYYYLISNLLSMLIMWGIKKYFIDEKKIRMQIEANKLKPKATQKSKWQQKLEDMQKQRAEQMRKKK